MRWVTGEREHRAVVVIAAVFMKGSFSQQWDEPLPGVIFLLIASHHLNLHHLWSDRHWSPARAPANIHAKYDLYSGAARISHHNRESQPHIKQEYLRTLSVAGQWTVDSGQWTVDVKGQQDGRNKEVLGLTGWLAGWLAWYLLSTTYSCSWLPILPSSGSKMPQRYTTLLYWPLELFPLN